MPKKRSFIHLYTGSGEGKTITAFGLALRSIGHGHKAVVIQFMKGRKDIGEYMVRRKLSPEYEIRQFGRKEFIDLMKPAPVDFELARKGLEFARKAVKKKPDILVLDEINLAVAIGLLKLEDVLNLLDSASGMTIVLTGRNAPKELIERADLVTEMREVKHPMRKGVGAREGIEY